MFGKRAIWPLNLLAATAILFGSAVASDKALQPDMTALIPRFGFDNTFPSRIDAGTEIRYAVPSNDPTELEVFDIYGQRVALLVDLAQPAGSHSIVWDGKDSSNTPIVSGVYFIRLKSGGYSEIRKVIVVRQAD